MMEQLFNFSKKNRKEDEPSPAEIIEKFDDGKHRMCIDYTKDGYIRDIWVIPENELKE